MAHWLAGSRDWQVCGTCCQLRGPFVWRLKGMAYDHVQECDCPRQRRTDGERPETWRGFDYNTVAELCQACGCRVLDSGSRFSIWFCRECRQRATDLNAELGRTLVPIGRHSILHGVASRTTPKPTEAEIGAFVNRFGALVERMRRLRDWGHVVVRRNLSTVGYADATEIALTDYLAAVSGIDRAGRSEEMVMWMTLDRHDLE